MVHSQLLEGNPLGDPTCRALYVYCPPGAETQQDARLPAVCLLQGFAGRLEEWLTRTSSEPTVIERLDAMFAAGGCPPAVIVFVDAWTSCGTSQFLSSAGTGRMAEAHADALRGMRRIYLDAGRQDEFFLDLGAQGLSREFARLGIDHALELFDGKHDASTDRYADAIRELVCALSDD